MTVTAQRLEGIAYREALPAGGGEGAPVALLLHGFPESSHMWLHLLDGLAAAGWRAIAPDLPGYGDSELDPPGTWERHVEALERFRGGLGLTRAALVVHDWGGLIGLRWACDHPGVVSALVISGTGFFADGKWHGLARALRTPDVGEELVERMTRQSFTDVFSKASTGIGDESVAEYYKAFDRPEGRQGVLDLYRSGDFEKLRPYEGRLEGLGVPALLLWGETDAFAPVAGAHRFRRQLPEADLEVLAGVGHFVFEDAPERTTPLVVDFLGRTAAAAA